MALPASLDSGGENAKVLREEVDLLLRPLADATDWGIVENRVCRGADAVLGILLPVGPGALLAAGVGLFMQIEFRAFCHGAPGQVRVSGS